jgi:hypothetical protein
MHDETDRVLAATTRNTVPLISGDPAAGNRGEGVAAAVFPSAQGPVQTPPPQLHTPYAPTPQPQGFGPSTPPPSAYGYPQQGGAPQTPPPSAAYGMSAPPSLQSVPQQHMGGGRPPGGGMGAGPGGGRKRNTPLIVGGAVAAVAVIVVVSIIVAMSGGGSGTPDADSTTTAPVTSSATDSTAPSPTDDVVQGDQSRTIESTECTKAHNDLINPGKPNLMTMPDFTSIYVDSAVACMKAANWSYEIKDMDEQQWGKGTITAQTPKSLEDFDINSSQKITIWVSTGKGAS